MRGDEMTVDLKPIVEWLAPVISAIIVAVATGQINARLKLEDERRSAEAARTDEKRRIDAEWRERMEEHMDEQDRKISAILGAQCSQMRSDIIHKCHRYLDDLGCAGVEEKQSLHAEYMDYQTLCSEHDIVNHFVDSLVKRVMELPEREI